MMKISLINIKYTMNKYNKKVIICVVLVDKILMILATVSVACKYLIQ